jgi:hypothetical protein
MTVYTKENPHWMQTASGKRKMKRAIAAKKKQAGTPVAVEAKAKTPAKKAAKKPRKSARASNALLQALRNPKTILAAIDRQLEIYTTEMAKNSASVERDRAEFTRLSNLRDAFAPRAEKIAA